MKIIYTFLILALICSEVFGGDGGLKIKISQEGLNYAANIAVDTLLINLKEDTINDVEGTNGKLTYELKNVKIEDLSRPLVEANLMKDQQEIAWRLSNINIKASLDWRYRLRQNRYLKISDSGRVEISANGLSIKVLLKMEYDETTGRPVIRATHCESIVDNLDINFRNRVSWIYDAIADLAERPIKNLLTEELCRGAKRALNKNANDEFKTLKVESRLSDGILFNFKLVSPPLITQSCLESLHSGCVHLTDQYDCSMDHPLMTKSTEGRMLAISLSAQSLNSWAKSSYIRGEMNSTIRSSHLEDEHQHYFDTDCKSGFCMVSFLPNVAQNYPNSKLEADFITLAPPTLSINPSKLTSNIKGIIKMFVRTPNDERTELFEVKTNVELVLIAEMQDNFMKFKISQFTPNIEILSISVPDIPEDGLTWAAKLAGKVLVNKSNLRSQQGIPLVKMDDVSFINSSLTFEQDYLHMITDVLYTRPSH